MQLTGLAFLRMTASHAIVQGQRALLLPLCWRVGPLRRTVTAFWVGQEADVFYHQHLDHLRAGCALTVTLVDLHPHKDTHGIDLHAKVASCALAPARWVDHLSESRQAVAA